MSVRTDKLSAQRNKKVQETFHDLAPLWLIDDEYRAREDSFFFNVVYLHPVHGWINQRARFDTFNNNLYHLGEARVSEEGALQLQELEPFASGTGAASTPNNPANRL
jgi:hypothetical protein